MPVRLATTIRTAAEFGETGEDEPIITIDPTRTLRRWVENTREELDDETGDEGWLHHTTLDLRQTWTTTLADAEVDPLIAMDWSGWEDRNPLRCSCETERMRPN